MRAAIRIGLLALNLVGVLIPALAVAGQNVATWTDNANNEANQRIERTVVPDLASCIATATGFAEIAVVGMDVVTFTDTAVTEDVTYCYRLRAWNTEGFSLYSAVAGRKVPLVVPIAQSNLAVN